MQFGSRVAGIDVHTGFSEWPTLEKLESKSQSGGREPRKALPVECTNFLTLDVQP
jgi:hypothetical protein